MKKAKRMTQKAWHAEQSWYYEALWEASGEKLRLRIRRNTYDFQSYAIIEIYDPAQRKWNDLAAIPFANMASMAINAYTRPEDFERNHLIRNFEADENTLLNEARMVLGN